jgi:hypothetical protein
VIMGDQAQDFFRLTLRQVAVSYPYDDGTWQGCPYVCFAFRRILV